MAIVRPLERVEISVRGKLTFVAVAYVASDDFSINLCQPITLKDNKVNHTGLCTPFLNECLAAVVRKREAIWACFYSKNFKKFPEIAVNGSRQQRRYATGANSLVHTPNLGSSSESLTTENLGTDSSINMSILKAKVTWVGPASCDD